MDNVVFIRLLTCYFSATTFQNERTLQTLGKRSVSLSLSQVPIQSFWHPDRAAVYDQCSGGSAAAAALHHYGGTSEWRCLLGKKHTSLSVLFRAEKQ